MREGFGRLEDAQDIIGLIEATPLLMTRLRAVQDLHLPDCWIGAGALRNAVWNVLHGFDTNAGPETDVDVVYFDPEDVEPDRESALEARLVHQVPGVRWEVRNQARMHLRNDDPAYRDTEDGLRFWPETATAVAARLQSGKVELLTPFGTGDLLGLVVRPTPAFRRKPEIYRARQAAKNWAARWPLLKFPDA
jgi:hypothetical protein